MPQIDKRQLKLWDLISNDSLRLLLVECEQAFEMGKNTICLVGCKIAFNKINFAIRSEKLNSKVIGQIEQTSYSKSLPFGIAYEPSLAKYIDILSEKIATALKELQEDTEIANLGLSMATTSEFRKFTNSIQVNSSLNGTIEILRSNGIAEETYNEFAKSALDYISNLSRLAQEVYPDTVAKIEIPIPLSKQSAWDQI